MAQKKPLDRYVEAGKEFTEASRKCLEWIAHGLSKESEAGRDHAEQWARDMVGRAKEGGESGREHAEDWAEELVERGRRAAEQLGELVRREVGHQIKQFNLATNQDVIKVVQQFVERTTKAATPVRDAASRTMAATKKSAGKKAAPAKKAPRGAKAPADKAAPSKRAPAKKAAPVKKAAAKKAPRGAKAPADKAAPSKRAPAKKAAAVKKSQPSTS